MVALAVVIVLLVIGSLIFHFASPWYFTPIASNWSTIDFTVDVTFWVCGIVFVAVNLFTAYCVWRFRARKDKAGRAHYEPESKKLEIVLTVFTAIGVAAMLTPGLFVWGKFVTVPEDAKQFEAVGKQWHWSYRLPGKDNKFGHTDVRFMTVDNPLGIDPDDPVGKDDVVVADPTFHLLVNQPVHVLLRSADVLHDFTVPQFRVKMDLVPGTVTYQWFTPTKVGKYELLCEELCGIGHFAMRGRIIVEEPADYAKWLATQPTFADTQARPVGNATAGAANYAVCSACHGPRGEGNQQLNAPKLAGLNDWYMRRQLLDFQHGVRGAEKGDMFGPQMAPMSQTVADPATRENVLAHIETLPDNPAAATVTGDVEHGRRLFETCHICHGDNGEGRWGTNAPKLAGMSDWYLVRQLEYFKARVRGGHEGDIYGDQMNMIANSLVGPNAINDVVAYINTLR
ncbi:MAG TPA: c-type cytochrome [Gammaproteobacteria bacterium]|nr:c-type cytochrome [Gammaproteobacteria bacterium]